MAQGQSLSAVLLEAGRAPHEGPHAYWISFYVGVSRAPSLDRLLLLGEPDWEALRAGPPPELVEEIERLAGLAAATSAELARLIATRSGALPADIPPAAAAATPLDADTPLADVPDQATLAPLGLAQLRTRLCRPPFGATAFACARGRFNSMVAAASRPRLLALFAALRLAPPVQPGTRRRPAVPAPHQPPTSTAPPATRRRRAHSASPPRYPAGSAEADLQQRIQASGHRRARSASPPTYPAGSAEAVMAQALRDADRGAPPPPRRRRR